MIGQEFLACLLVGILGGEKTAGFPECVAVGDGTTWRSSGVLVAPNVVLTAGSVAASRNAERVFIGPQIDDKGGSVIRVRRVIIHPEYQQRAHLNDLAILILDEDVRLDELPRFAPSELINRADSIQVVGFGTEEERGLFGFGIKREVTIRVVSSSGVDPGAADSYGANPATELVAKDREAKKDANQGDGGGPAFVKGPDGRRFLAAIVLRATRNSKRRAGDGSIYLRLDRYRDWVRTTALNHGGHWPEGP